MSFLEIQKSVLFLRVFFILLPFFFFSSCGYNSLQALDEDVKAAWAEVENQYQRRSDLIPNLVETVKAYSKHERETLESVIRARASATQLTLKADSLSDPNAMKKFEAAQGELSSALSRLLVSVERYPDLKANTQFRDLSSQLEGTENRIAVARKRYIDSVASFNKSVRAFPTNLTAKFLLGLNVRETLSVKEEAKTVPKVSF